MMIPTSYYYYWCLLMRRKTIFDDMYMWVKKKRFQTVPQSSQKKNEEIKVLLFPLNSLKFLFTPFSSNTPALYAHRRKNHQYHDFVVVVVIVIVRGMCLLKILLLLFYQGWEAKRNETNRIQLSRRQKFSTSSSR